MDQTHVARKCPLCQKLINTNRHGAREARINFVGRIKFVKITDIIIFVSASNSFIDYGNTMPSEITLAYSLTISVTLNNFWEHCSHVP